MADHFSDQENQQDDDDEEIHTTSFDWKAIFKMAEDPDIEEDQLSPIEMAVKVLEDEKSSEIARMKVIRSISDHLETDPDLCMEKVLPALQHMLREEKTNLDLHCEAAVQFKEILRNDALMEKQSYVAEADRLFRALGEVLLGYILQNAQRQKDNPIVENKGGKFVMDTKGNSESLSAAAWLETLTEVAECLPLSSLKASIIPVLTSQSDPNQRVQRRLIATKLLHKLATILPSIDIRRDLATPIQTLCADVNANVRISMAQRLPTIASSLGRPSDVVSIVLTPLLKLCEEDELSVKEAAVPSLIAILPQVSKDARKGAILTFFRNSFDAALEKKDEKLILFGRNFGSFVDGLIQEMDVLDQSWAINSFITLVAAFRSREEEKQHASLCRRACAFNLPCMMKYFPKANERLIPIIEEFCNDHDDEVRLSMAASFHELLDMSNNKRAMVSPFVELLRGGSIDAVGKISHHLSTILPLLYKCVMDGSTDKNAGTNIDRLLLGCNQIVEGTGAWRAHESLLSSLTVLPSLLPASRIFSTFVPLLRKMVLTVRAYPCRMAASRSLLILMKHQRLESNRKSIIEFLTKELAGHSSSYRRLLYIDVVLQVCSLFSRRILHTHFLQSALALANDPVSNVRLKLIRCLPHLKPTCVLPQDEELLKNLESTVRILLDSENGTHTKQLIHSAAKELSRTDTGKDTGEDRERVAEEDKLWDETVDEEDKKPPKLLQKPRMSEMSQSMIENPLGWRSERRAIAVVRPQPIVVMRSPSPAASLEMRKSRLPLSTSKTNASKYSSPRESSTRSTPPVPPPREVRSQSESRRTSDTTVNSEGKGYTRSSSSSYAIMKSQSTSHLKRPSYGLTKVSSQSNIERRPPSLSMRIRNINVL